MCGPFGPIGVSGRQPERLGSAQGERGAALTGWEERAMGDSTPQEGPPPGGLLELALSSLLVKAIYTVVESGIIDLVADGPRTGAELADQAGLVPEKLGQVLRALTAIGLFSEGADGRFTLTPAGQTLQTGHPS